MRQQREVATMLSACAGALLAAVVIAAAVAFVLSHGTAHGAGFTVNVLFDESDSNPGDGFCRGIITPNVCTLRAAIQEANALDGDDTITLPVGTLTLTAFHGGDLDVTDFFTTLTIIGAGASQTIIDGGGIDRVFNVGSLATLEISGVTIRNGSVTGNGGGIFNGGTLA